MKEVLRVIGNGEPTILLKIGRVLGPADEDDPQISDEEIPQAPKPDLKF